MNTLAFANFILIKLFPTLIRQNFPPSKICAVQYVNATLPTAVPSVELTIIVILYDEGLERVGENVADS